MTLSSSPELGPEFIIDVVVGGPPEPDAIPVLSPTESVSAYASPAPVLRTALSPFESYVMSSLVTPALEADGISILFEVLVGSGVAVTNPRFTTESPYDVSSWVVFEDLSSLQDPPEVSWDVLFADTGESLTVDQMNAWVIGGTSSGLAGPQVSLDVSKVPPGSYIFVAQVATGGIVTQSSSAPVSVHLPALLPQGTSVQTSVPSAEVCIHFCVMML